MSVLAGLRLLVLGATQGQVRLERDHRIEFVQPAAAELHGPTQICLLSMWPDRELALQRHHHEPGAAQRAGRQCRQQDVRHDGPWHRLGERQVSVRADRV